MNSKKKRLFAAFFRIVVMAVAILNPTPDAVAADWTARELVEYSTNGEDAFEAVIGSANENYWTKDFRPVKLSVKELEEADGSKTEVLVVSNFHGAFDLYLTVKGDVVSAYKVDEHYAFPATGGGTVLVPGTDGVMASSVVITPVNVAYNLYGDNYAKVKWKYDAPYYPDGDLEHSYYKYVTSERMNELQPVTVYDDLFDAIVHPTDWHTHIETNDYDNLQMHFSYWAHNSACYLGGGSVLLEYKNDAGETVATEVMGQYLLNLFKRNAMITDSNHDEDHPYYVKIKSTANDNGVTDFVITNFADYGYLSNNNIPIPTAYINYFTGHIIGTDVVIDNQPSHSVVEGDMTDDGHPRPITHDYFFFGFDKETRTPQKDITGTFIPNHPEHQGNGKWVYTVPGGDLRTYEVGVIQLDPYGEYERETECYHATFSDIKTHEFVSGELPYNGTAVEDAVWNTVVHFDFKKDVTFDCSLGDIKFTYANAAQDGSDAQDIDVSATLTITKNPLYTSRYEVYVVEGTSTSDATVINPKLDKAKYVGEIVANGNSVYEFTGKFHSDTPVGVTGNTSLPYSLYVVAHYDISAVTADSTLAPSYHALTPYSFYIMTGIDNMDVDSVETSISGGNGIINVSNPLGKVEVYDMLGNSVYAGTDAAIHVERGIYIVHAGCKVAKVIVR